MKVIENKYPQEESWKVICPHCQSILEYTKADVKSHESMFFYLHTIECPCCHKTVDVQKW